MAPYNLREVVGFLHTCSTQFTQPHAYNRCIRITPEDAREEWEEVDEVVAVAHAELDVLGHDLRRVVVDFQLRQGELPPVAEVVDVDRGLALHGVDLEWHSHMTSAQIPPPVKLMVLIKDRESTKLQNEVYNVQ